MIATEHDEDPDSIRDRMIDQADQVPVSTILTPFDHGQGLGRIVITNYGHSEDYLLRELAAVDEVEPQLRGDAYRTLAGYRYVIERHYMENYA